ncbi:heme biosynthesis protein HemY [Marinomonas rhizomae]|uniref:Uroporphyrin-3 C-methyltransferase n=1 Tax=Marinomonas rhizomae TaxID=491948 RepID=A0A366J5S4_9GAMM|nr:uroporphyrinogen-III C-methyltransferase [Marinomonas rhizomae]RBP82391.1 uroporphyrin-3 C-methyltransferase [Marinomonas rhizomae]RNF73810.1 heme biosynthesis protein HemY [Marinomonas rhizomae]
MTDNNKQAQESNEAIEKAADTTPRPELQSGESKAQPPKETGQKQPATSPIKTFAVLSLGLSVIAIATSGWLYFQSTKSTLPSDFQQLAAQQIALDSKLNTNQLNKSQLTQLIDQVKASEQTILLQKTELATQQAQQDEKLLSLESKLNRLNNTTKEDWKLAEAEYLIRLANQRLLLEADNNGAATLLVNADDILNELEDPIVFATRKALAKDIQALRSISQFDLEGAYLNLNALYDNVQTLPQREPSQEWQASTKEKTQQTEHSATEKLTSVLESFWQSLRSLVVINYNHKPIKALLPPAEYQELITGIQLQLEIAQVALIKGEPVIYQQALSRVANATTEHFETKSNRVTTFLASLTALQQLNPSPDLPLPRASLMSMKSLMKEWNKRNSNNPNTSDNAEQSQIESENKGESMTAPQIDLGDRT